MDEHVASVKKGIDCYSGSDCFESFESSAWQRGVSSCSTEADFPGDAPWVRGATGSSTDSFGVADRPKHQMLNLVVELLEGFSTEDFQEKICDLHLSNISHEEFSQARRRLAFAVQRQVLPKYGFQANADGLKEALNACASYSGDDDMDETLTAVDVMLGVTLPNSLKMSKVQAVVLGSELLRMFSRAAFQENLACLAKQHGRGTGDFQVARLALVLSVKRPILLECGLPGTPSGAHELQKAFASFHGDSEIAELMKAIETKIGNGEKLLGSMLPVAEEEEEAKPRFSKQLAVAMSRELLIAFSDASFQKLWQEVPRNAQALEQRMEAKFSVQRSVLPTYGFPFTADGVSAWNKAMMQFRGDEEICQIAEAINEKLKICSATSYDPYDPWYVTL